MARIPLFTASVAAALAFSAAAHAQFGVPPPGSAQGTESGVYGSSIGTDVRGTGPVDRFGRSYDPMNPTDTGRKPVDSLDTNRKSKPDANTPGSQADALSQGRSSSANMPGANMNPGLTPPSAGGIPPSASPNLNPGMGPAAPGSANGPASSQGAARPR